MSQTDLTRRVPEAWARWCRSRRESVRAVPGNLALVSYQPITPDPAPIEGSPQATIHRPDDREGAVVSAPGSLDLRVDGELVDGEAFVARLGASGAPVIRSGTHAYEVYSLDGSDYELRIYDHDAPNRSDFERIDVFDYDPTLVVPAEWRPYESTGEVPWDFTRAADSGHVKKVPGTIALEMDGDRYELLAFLDGEQLVLVFSDATTGAESYAPGRFLRVPRAGDDSRIDLDFNYAFVPPCGFSDFYSCPIPPPQNKLAVPVRAGERAVVWSRPRH